MEEAPLKCKKPSLNSQIKELKNQCNELKEEKKKLIEENLRLNAILKYEKVTYGNTDGLPDTINNPDIPDL